MEFAECRDALGNLEIEYPIIEDFDAKRYLEIIAGKANVRELASDDRINEITGGWSYPEPHSNTLTALCLFLAMGGSRPQPIAEFLWNACDAIDYGLFYETLDEKKFVVLVSALQYCTLRFTDDQVTWRRCVASMAILSREVTARLRFD